jgi:tripartite-type tricarboxylate transporter receptor subunit TctC
MRTRLALVSALLAASIGIAAAQDFPSRPITIVYPFAAGGPGDIIARVIAEPMRAALGQPVIVETMPGANGNIGAGRIARADANGYSLLLGTTSTHVLNGALYPLQHDVIKDFEPVALVADSSLIVTARKTMPANDLKELIAWLKANPDKASQGYAGNGSPGHMSSLLFQSLTGTKMQFVPYRGTAAAMQDLIAGQIDVVFTSPIVALPPARSGHVKAYAVTSRTRLSSAPDIPTAEEAGLPGFVTSSWFALFAPKATPRDIVAKLNGAVVNALTDPLVRARFAELGLEMFPREQQTPAALAAFQRAEIEKWWPIIKAAGIKVE